MQEATTNNSNEQWQAVTAMLTERFGKLPDMESILFLIGMNEFGQPPSRSKFTKEQKQDLMHIAICSLLAPKGYYEFTGRDDEGWPHFIQLKPVPADGLEAQEGLLRSAIIEYFGV